MSWRAFARWAYATTVAKRRPRPPEPFAWDGYDEPADALATASAMERFVATFVVAIKRERMLGMLFHKDQGKRIEAIQTADKWIDPTLRQAELVGDTGVPRHLKRRFDDLRGILFNEDRGRHVTIAGAAVLAKGAMGEWGAIFIADGKPISLLFPEIGPPTLCAGR
jgi:hypothetical protein